MVDIQIRHEEKRGCGWRMPGGLYLMGTGESTPCARMPLPLTACSACSAGIKPARSWTWLTVPCALWDASRELCWRSYCSRCPLSRKVEEQRGELLWCGEGSVKRIDGMCPTCPATKHTKSQPGVLLSVSNSVSKSPTAIHGKGHAQHDVSLSPLQHQIGTNPTQDMQSGLISPQDPVLPFPARIPLRVHIPGPERKALITPVSETRSCTDHNKRGTEDTVLPIFAPLDTIDIDRSLPIDQPGKVRPLSSGQVRENKVGSILIGGRKRILEVGEYVGMNTSGKEIIHPIGCTCTWQALNGYPTPEAWLQEAHAQGISRRITVIPREFKLGRTWVLMAHRKAIGHISDDPKERFTPGIFYAFRPTAIEYIVKGDETEERLENLVKRGITPVRVERIIQPTHETDDQQVIQELLQDCKRLIDKEKVEN